jgi:hypothetical protein
MRAGNAVMTQGTGYFSNSEKCDPILDSKIPQWIKKLRGSSGNGTGTSIVVPFPDLGLAVDDFWQDMQISIIHNFYLAIKNKNLEVDFNGQQSLNASNLLAQFEKLLMDLERYPTDDFEYRMAALECAKTIEFHSEDKTGVLVSKPFGRVSWYMRIGEPVVWRGVGIARQNGMLITETPQNLLKFPGTKPFDLFLCVEGESGSRILRSIEDPSHTKFEFDRIPDLEERQEAESSYKAFVREVRQLILEHAAMDASEEEFIDDLNEFFSGVEADSINDGNAEISNKLTFDPIRKIKPLRPARIGADSGQGGSEDNLPQPAPGEGKSVISGGNPAVDFGGTTGSSGKNYELPLGDGEDLLALSSARVINSRHGLDLPGGDWVLDVFLADNAPLVVAEVELSSANQVVEVPPWCGRELTGRHDLSNAALALRPLVQWGEAERRELFG